MEDTEFSSMKKSLSAEFESKEEIFVILGDHARISIICLLLENGPMKVEEITNNIYLSRPAVSHHLKALKDAGMLAMEEKSRYNYYYLDRNSTIWRELSDFFGDVGRFLDCLEEKKDD